MSCLHWPGRTRPYKDASINLRRTAPLQCHSIAIDATKKNQSLAERTRAFFTRLIRNHPRAQPNSDVVCSDIPQTGVGRLSLNPPPNETQHFYATAGDEHDQTMTLPKSGSSTTVASSTRSNRNKPNMTIQTDKIDSRVDMSSTHAQAKHNDIVPPSPSQWSWNYPQTPTTPRFRTRNTPSVASPTGSRRSLSSWARNQTEFLDEVLARPIRKLRLSRRAMLKNQAFKPNLLPTTCCDVIMKPEMAQCRV